MTKRVLLALGAIAALGACSSGSPEAQPSATTAKPKPATTTEAPTTTAAPTTTVECYPDGVSRGQYGSHEVCRDGEWQDDPQPRPTTTTAAPATTAAPTTTLPPTTTAPPTTAVLSGPWASPSRNDGVFDTEEHAVILASDTLTPAVSSEVWDLFVTTPAGYAETARLICDRFREGLTRAEITPKVLNGLPAAAQGPVATATLLVGYRVAEYMCAAADPGISTQPLLPDAQYPYGIAPSVEEAAADPASNKGDGIYRVGEQMAPGLWISTGTAGERCYWEIRPIGSTDTIDNHYGAAGGSVTLAPGHEFETTGCGQWSHR